MIQIKQVGIALFLLLFILIPPLKISAHSQNDSVIPAPDSILKEPPSEINLLFNERLEKELYYIKVFDDRGLAATNNLASMSLDQKSLHLALPSLGEGVYTVSYKIISADGHPVKASYVFMIGKPTYPTNDDVVNKKYSHGSLVHSDLFWELRFSYYLSFLLFIGWVLGNLYLNLKTEKANKTYSAVYFHLRNANLLFLSITIAVQGFELIEGSNALAFMNLLTGTMIGFSWMVSFTLSVASYFILRRTKWLDGLWVLLMIFAKSINGHAYAVEPPYPAVLLDSIHLLAAAAWIGGVTFIILFWRNHREETMRFLPRFSQIALTSLIVLIVSGTLSTLLLLPKINYVLETAWGTFLLIKISLVLTVISIGILIRYSMKNNSYNRLRTLLTADFISMFLIIAIVGVFTYLSPVPANQPLYWSEIRGSLNASVQITPNAPGNNQFSIYSFTPNKELDIKNVELEMTNRDIPEMAPIMIPLQKVTSSDSDAITDIKQYLFTSEGSYLPFSGRWTAKLKIRNTNDDEQIFDKSFRIY